MPARGTNTNPLRLPPPTCERVGGADDQRCALPPARPGALLCEPLKAAGRRCRAPVRRRGAERVPPELRSLLEFADRNNCADPIR